jgi:hypothetical protein
MPKLRTHFSPQRRRVRKLIKRVKITVVYLFTLSTSMAALNIILYNSCLFNIGLLCASAVSYV